jgi:SGNH domain (fused to AT3 domains)
VTEGQTLTEEHGAWTNGPTAFAYQWEDCDAAGASCSAIAGATGQTYTLMASDVGQTIRVLETAANADGSSQPASSRQTSAVLPLPPANLDAPSISGTALAGQALTEAHGSWTNSPTGFTYQWDDCDGSGSACAPIDGATGQTYVLTGTDVGHTIEVLETASNAGGQGSPSGSAPTALVQAQAAPPSPPADQAPPAISGPDTVGQLLSATTGTWSGSLPIAYAYQWERCDPHCSAIAGATGASYTSTPADAGGRLLVTITATNVAGVTAASSAEVGPISSGGFTVSQIRTLLLAEIAPTGARAAIAAVLRAGGYTLAFRALGPGVADVDWYDVPPGAYIAAKAKAVLVASGTLSFPAAGTRELRMELTAAGRKLLESEQASDVEVLKVTAKATFRPAGGGPAISVSSTQAPAPSAGPPACFGAAARDRLRPCQNPSLEFSVRPTPDQALIIPNAACTPAVFTGLVIPCLFGFSASPTTDEIALLGDSHAETWRAALTYAADSLDWHGISLTRSSCSYSSAIPVLAPSLVSQCVAWRAGVVAWFRANPRVGTVFVSDNDNAAAVTPRGRTSFATEVTGYLDAWHALPDSVKHIVVIRDSPFPGISTAPCVDQAITEHKQAGVACALQRATALQPDPEATAAAEYGPRASVIDMTEFFCTPTVCPPVIGGVLVYKDGSHMTDLYSTTLGPYLLAKIGRLLASWTR